MPTQIDEVTLQRLLSPVPEGGDPTARLPDEDVGLCLSGGGYRAMLFHAGVLWRLNELGFLPKLDRISSVSGGSITAGVLGLAWKDLVFDAQGIATGFGDAVVEPIRRMASTSIDVSSVVSGALLPGVSISERIADRYAKTLYKQATLQDLPQSPVFVFCATNVQTGSLLRFSRKRLADWKVGEYQAPDTPIAVAVAASSAFPPVLSPAELKLKVGVMQAFPDSSLAEPPFNTDLVLSDGGVYDNLGIEPVWKRCRTVLVSDAGQKLEPEGTPAEDWARHMLRVLGIIDDQVRSLRKRQVIGSLRAKIRHGAYWGIRTDIADYQLRDALDCPHEKTLSLAATPTRLTETNPALQKKLINWGYAVCDAGMRKHVVTGAAPALKFPYPLGVG